MNIHNSKFQQKIEDFSKIIQANTDLCLIAVNADGTIIYADDKSEKFLSLTKKDLLNRSIYSILDDSEAIVLRTNLLNNKPISQIVYYQHENKIKWFNFTISKDEDGENATILIQNQTALMHLDEDMNIGLTHQRAIFNSTKSLIWSVDRQFRLTAFNEAFMNFVNDVFQAEIKIGQSALEVLSEGDPLKKKWQKQYEIALEGKRGKFSEKITHKGKIVHFQIALNPILRSGDKIVGVAGFAVDKTPLIKKIKEVKQEADSAKRYQSMLLRSQLNPHFMFNALNSIQYYILEQDTFKAIDFLSQFAKLVRKTLYNSGKEVISLEEEMEFLDLYLSLEKSRFGDKFTYRIEADLEDIENTYIPPMLIQPFAENSLIHGLGKKAEGGRLVISFKTDKDNLICTIKDDGVGRGQSSIKTDEEKHKSMAMGITCKRIELLQDLEALKFEFTINDLKLEDGSAAGTEVVLKYPMEYATEES